MMHGSTLIVGEKDVVVCDLGDDAALLDLRSSTYFTLSPVGAFVWRQMTTPVSPDALCEAVMAEYAVEPARCRSDIDALIDQLDEAGLVRVA